MTVEELKAKEDAVRAVIDSRWDDNDRRIAYAYLHRAYKIRISDCEKKLAALLLN